MNNHYRFQSFIHAETGMRFFTETFFYTFSHEGECAYAHPSQSWANVPYTEWPKLYRFQSEIYQRFWEKEARSPLSQWTLDESEEIKYVKSAYSDRRLFAILFGRRLGLSDMQLTYMASCQEIVCWYALNWFLCRPQAVALPSDLSETLHPAGLRYSVFINHARYPAHIETDKLFLDKTGQVLEIL